MKVRVNGEEREVPPGCSVAGLLQRMGLAEVRLAVELNRRVLPRERLDQSALTEGDALEIVTFVGGG